MKSVADFKRAMVPGSEWTFTADWWPTPTKRTCTVHQSNSFALTSVRNPDEHSWGDWPKRDQVKFVDGGIEITHEYGWLRYIPIEKKDETCSQ
jgi:hypothetical protein